MNENSPDHPHEPPTDVDAPATLRITSKPFEASREQALDAVERWERGESSEHVVNFQDASRLQRVLTPRRLELVQDLLEAPAESIRALADRIDRDVRQVHDDLQLLQEYRIVHFEDDGSAKQPFVPYETINIEVELAKPDRSSESSAPV